MTMERYRSFYERYKHPDGLREALWQCQEDKVPPPDWLVEAIESMIMPLAMRRPGRGQLSPNELVWQDAYDKVRWYKVMMLRKQGVSARESFQAAADYFARAPEHGNPGGGADAIERSYRRIRRRRKQAGLPLKF